MSTSPKQIRGLEELDISQRSTSYFPTSKDRLLEQKRAEHEYARQEHRRRFEEQMALLESKQQRDEALINGVDEEGTHPDELLPVTPVKTPAQTEARSRASTINKLTPPLKVFDSRMGHNEQLATPPSEHLSRPTPAYSTAPKSVPGSRRTSLGFDALSFTDHSEQRRISQPESIRTFPGQENHRFALPKLRNEEAPPTYLQMNTTDDSFPILVRKDNFSSPAASSVTVDLAAENRNIGPPASASFGINALPRNNPTNIQSQRGLSDDSEASQARPLPEFSLQSAQKHVSDNRVAAYNPLEPNRKSFSAMSTPAGRSPLGPLSSLSATLHHSPLHSPALYNPYSIVQPLYHGHHNQPGLSSFPIYGMNQLQHINAQELQKIQNPYAMVRNANYNKRSPEDANRYADVALETLIGDIYSLCKDQHGCRYLQKKLDERNSVSVDLIFAETYSHAAELMIDPFGNYLCQKLLEHSDDQKRLKIVQTVAPDLVNISLNMHGTRAIQKMIEYLNTSEQIKIATKALDTNAVTLIKDLNGNHVIQKCLNRLGSHENQFIFDAVSKNCVEVATHRHGCCVLQRCIDHASEEQRMQIVNEITTHAPVLIQDPFGNYVVQYVLDLGDVRLSDRLINRFVGNVCLFSVQKFSSNVIEKCLRVAEPATRARLIEELLHKSRLEKLLRDSFANYVIQTALDYAEPVQRQQLVECIRPLLPAIRSTPYGRRIQSKISGNLAGTFSGNFMAPVAVHSLPGYSFNIGPAVPPLSNFANYRKSSFKADYEY